jgi:hypothetical protein
MERLVDGVNDVVVSHDLGKGAKQRGVTRDRRFEGSSGMDEYPNP